MLKKLRLDQKNKYEKAIASRAIAKMVVAYAQGRNHIRNIGSEQGGISHWDDFVIEDEHGVYNHLQVKNQTTPFSAHECLRKLKRGSSELNDLSAFDEVIKSLGQWHLVNDVEAAVPKRKFKLICSDGSVDINKEITINHLARLCNDDISRLSTIALFKQLICEDEAANNIWTWLSSFCEFSDEAHALKTLKNLKIVIVGNAESIKEDILDQLRICFNEPDTVLTLINGILDEHSTYTSVITAHAVLKDLHNYLLPGTKKWTQYYLQDSTWKVSGITDAINPDVELPSSTVPAHWDPEQLTALRITSRLHTSNLTKALIRLVFHLHNLSTAHLSDASDWINLASKMVGDTLGVREGDTSKKSLQISEDKSLNTTCSRNLEKTIAHDEEAARLNHEMDSLTWKETAELVADKILQMDSSPLKIALDSRWCKWKAKLDESKDDRNVLLLSMLSPSAEGKDIEIKLRFGPKTTTLLRDGIFLLLIVSVCLTEKDDEWGQFGENLTVSACALSMWSGPVGSKKVQTIFDDGIEKLLGLESSKILILPNVHNSPTELIGSSMASPKKSDDSLASPHQPKVVITNSSFLKKLIQKGDLDALRNYFKGEVENAMAPIKVSI